MFHTESRVDVRGFTLVELLVTVMVFTLFFGGLFTAIQFTLKLISASKASTSALALANEKIEYIRSLPYASVGTLSGIPNGLIPQNSTSSLNGVTFHERVLVEYVDSPDDGYGAADVNGILADYKRVKVEYSWANTAGTSTLFLLTDIVPPGIETTTGGGTLTVNVFDDAVLPVSSASVRLYNNTTTSTIDTTRFTNIDGVAMFAGAPAAANYQITVTKAGYSTDQTYSASTSNPNPLTPHVAVLESAVSTMNFQIDRLSDLLIRTVGPSTNGSLSDDFDDSSLLGPVNDTEVLGGQVVLTGGSGNYVPLGTVYATGTNPSVITSWGSASWNESSNASTSVTMHVYQVTGTSTYTLIPDVDLPGNAAGFTVSPITLTSLNVSTYDSLALGATLVSIDQNFTPAIEDWELSYVVTEPAIASVPVTLTGSKTIGTTAAAAPVYKYLRSHTSDGSGELELLDLEWDVYDVLVGGSYDVSQACPNVPYSLEPGVSDTVTLTLVPASTYSMRVAVVDADGNPVSGAQVEMSRSGFSETDNTSVCGQVFWNSGLTAASDYQVVVQKTGYVDQTVTDITIDGADTLVVTLIAS